MINSNMFAQTFVILSCLFDLYTLLKISHGLGTSLCVVSWSFKDLLVWNDLPQFSHVYNWLLSNFEAIVEKNYICKFSLKNTVYKLYFDTEVRNSSFDSAAPTFNGCYIKAYHGGT